MIIGNNANAGTVYFNTAFDNKSYNKNVKSLLSSTEKSFSTTFKKIGKLVGGALAIGAITKFTKSCIDLGSDLAEVQNVVDVVFPNINSQVNNFAKNAIDQFGLSELATKKYMGTFGAMSKSFGFSEQAAFEMSKTVTGLVGDVSSFYNISQDLAYTKLKSVWTGETETLKDLGIVMTQTALNEYALRNGFSKTIDKMTEAEKVSLRYSFVQSQLASATGDFARTSDGWANQIRVLSLRFDQLKASLGQGFINLFTPIVKCLNIVISKLQVVADGFSKFTSLLFGKQQQAISNTASQYNDLGTSAIQSANDIANASKKAQKAVMGYDKLNILTNTKDSSGSGSSSGDTSISTPTISTPTVDDTISPQMQKIVDKIMSYIEPLKNISFEPLIKSLGKLKDAFLPFAKNIFEGLEWGYFNILVPLAKFTIEDVIPTFLDLFSGSLKVLNTILTAFKDIFTPIWDNLLKPLLSWTGGAIIDTLKGVADALENIGNWMSSNQDVVDGIVISLGTFFGLWELTKLMGFIQMSGGIIGAFTGITAAIWSCTGAKFADKMETIAITALYAKDFLMSVIAGTGALIKQGAQWVITTGLKIADTTATVAGTAATWLATAATTAFGVAMTVLTSPITLVILAVAGLVAGIVLLVKNFDTVKEVAGKCWDGIKNIWNSVASWFDEHVVQPISNFFTGLWSNIQEKASECWSKITSLFSKGGQIFNGIKDGIVNVFKTVVNSLISGINTLIKIPFDKVNGMLNKIRGTSFLGVSPFKGLWKENPLPIPQIPKLAEGAWFKAKNPQLVMVGEGKSNEIVAPEPKLDDAIERGFKKYGNGGSGGKLEITIIHKYPDGRMMIDEINETQVKEGKILLNT